MTARHLFSGNNALAEGAIQAGCDAYFGYPITPQNEVPEYFARRMAEEGRVFVQSESELAAISMVMGAAATGMRAMTSSSSPGISLMQEGISYLSGCGLPAVIANVVRAGPGLGGIGPGQCDYFQAVKGGGHGDYHLHVLAPATVQETFDFMFLAFDLAFKYRNPVLILTDGLLGQMMEPLEIREPSHLRIPGVSFERASWALTGAQDRPGRHFKSLHLDTHVLEEHNRALQRKFAAMAADVRFDTHKADDAAYLFVAYGISARICRAAVDTMRSQGIAAGLLRPITLWPYPIQWLRDRTPWLKKVMAVELSHGQMIEDVERAVAGQCPVSFFGRTGGCVMTAEELVEAAVKEFDL